MRSAGNSNEWNSKLEISFITHHKRQYIFSPFLLSVTAAGKGTFLFCSWWQNQDMKLCSRITWKSVGFKNGFVFLIHLPCNMFLHHKTPKQYLGNFLEKRHYSGLLQVLNAMSIAFSVRTQWKIFSWKMYFSCRLIVILFMEFLLALVKLSRRK